MKWIMKIVEQKSKHFFARSAINTIIGTLEEINGELNNTYITRHVSTNSTMIR